jgi:hypothetical protein
MSRAPALLFVALGLTVAGSAFAQPHDRRTKEESSRPAASPTTRNVADSAELTVLARFVASSPSVACGGVKAVTVEHHQVVRVLSGHVAGTDLYVAVTCAELYAHVRSAEGTVVPRWPGQVFRLSLGPDKSDGARFDAFARREGPRYMLVDAPVWVPSGV